MHSKKVTVIISFLLFLNTSAIAQTNLAAIESSLIKNANNCNHLAGEVGDQSPERNKALNDAMEAVCPKAEKQAKILLRSGQYSIRAYEAFIIMDSLLIMKLTDSQIKQFCSNAKGNTHVFLCESRFKELEEQLKKAKSK